MRADTIRYQFASDNTAAICPEAWTALEQANAHYAPSYGEDEWTAEVCARIRQIFEDDCDVYFHVHRHRGERARSGPALPTLPRRALSRARPHPAGRRRTYRVLYPGAQICF